MVEFVKKWYPLIIFGIFAVAGPVWVFVSLKPKNTGEDAKYLDGRDLLEVGGVTYGLINDIESKTYIGSEVSDVVKAMRGEEKAKIISGGIMTIAVIYTVDGDKDGNYLIDAAGRLYAKQEIAERERERLKNPENFPVRKIVSSDKSMEGLKDVSAEAYEAILLAENDLSDNVRITDEQFLDSYGLRREIFAFTEDGLFFRASNELFIYNDEVYVTVKFLPASETKDKKAMLVGTKLPAEYQAEFRGLFPK